MATDKEIEAANDKLFPSYTGIKKSIFEWGNSNGYIFIESELDDLSAEINTALQKMNKTLLENAKSMNQTNQAILKKAKGIKEENEMFREALRFYADPNHVTLKKSGLVEGVREKVFEGSSYETELILTSNLLGTRAKQALGEKT